MNNEPELRDILRTELRAREHAAPAFEAVWSAAAATPRRARRRALITRTGALAAVIVFVCLTVLALRPPKTPPRATAAADLPWRSAVLLTEWRAPTDALLLAEPFSLEN